MQYAERSGRSLFPMYYFVVDQVEAARAALEAGRLVEARTTLETRGGDAPSQALLARVYHQLKLPQMALQAAQRAELRGRDAPLVQHDLALYYAKSGQRKVAAQWEARFARSNVADKAAPLRAAMLFAEAKQWNDALTYGRLALANEDRAETRTVLAAAAEAAGKPEEAIEHFRALLVLLPYDEDVHGNFGQALLRMARFNEAAVVLEEAERKFDKSPQIALALGVAYYSQRRFPDAGTKFLRVIDLAPEVPQSYIFLAKMLDQLPDRLPEIRVRAEAWYRSGKTNPFAPYVYARALQAGGEPDSKTKPILLEAIRRDASIWEFPFELGQLLERERDFAGAAKRFESSIVINAKLPEVHYRLSRVYDRLGQTAKADRERAIHKQLLMGVK